jgi:hypothetical protein
MISFDMPDLVVTVERRHGYILFRKRNVCIVQSFFILCIEHIFTVNFFVVSLNCKQTGIDQNVRTVCSTMKYVYLKSSKKTVDSI